MESYVCKGKKHLSGSERSIYMSTTNKNNQHVQQIQPVETYEAGRYGPFVQVRMNPNWRRELEKEFQSRAKGIANLVGFSGCGVIVVDASRRVVFGNEEFDVFTKIHGQVIGKILYEVLVCQNESDRKLLANTIDGVMATGHIVRTEIDFSGKDGQVLSALISIGPVGHEKKRVTEVVVLLQPILKPELDFFEESLSANFTATADGHIVKANQSFSELLGYTANAELQFSAEAIRRQFFEALISEKKLHRYELQLIRRDQKPVWVVGNFIGRFDRNGNLSGFAGLLSDTTEMRKMKDQLQQSQRMSSIGVLASGIAHDFNNLLMAMNASIYYMESEIPAETAPYEHISDLKQTVHRASLLSGQILNYARNQAPEMKLAAIDSIVEDFTLTLRRLVDDRISIHILPGCAGKLINCDRSQIEQVLLNLTINARDAMPNGGKLTIQTSFQRIDDTFCAAHPAARAGEFIRLDVEDSGQGIAPVILDRIFDPFFTTKGIGRGTGMGLSIVNGVVRNHHGFIHVESAVGRGTVFSVFLPLAEAVRTTSPGGGFNSRLGTDAAVLLVDDNQAIRDTSALILRNNGYHVITAKDGDEALSVFENSSEMIGLIILDVNLPGKSGIEVYRKIRDTNLTIPFVFVTGFGIGQLEGLTGEGTAVIQKPYEFKVLLEAINNLKTASIA